MLDDLKYIHQRDGQDALGIAGRQWKQLEHQFEITRLLALGSQLSACENVVFAGMGGSALAALVSQSWPGHSVPFEICRQYRIPKYVSERTLFIASSYSGNTEETVEALGMAEEHGAKMVVVTGGHSTLRDEPSGSDSKSGKLQDIAEAKNYPLLLIPKVEQPRYSVFYMLSALVLILKTAGLVKEKQTSAAIAQAAEFLKEKVADWVATVPTKNNPAKKLAEELAGKSVVIYAGPRLAPAAYKWKINFNENAKNVAWWNQLPEFNHNEMIGWAGHPIEKPYGIVELRSNLEHPRVQKRFEVSEKLLSGRRPAPNVVQVEGKTILEQLLWAIAFGDYVSIYLALLNNVNPAPVDLVEKFKTELNK